MVDTELLMGVYVCVRGYDEEYAGRKYWNCTGTEGLLSFLVSMVTGLGEDLCPGMGMRLALSPGYSAWTRVEEWIGCGTTLATGIVDVVTAVA